MLHVTGRGELGAYADLQESVEQSIQVLLAIQNVGANHQVERLLLPTRQPAQ
jgi:hypothetical protein